MRTSQYLTNYLEITSNPKTRYTIKSYLQRNLKGAAKNYMRKYAECLENSLKKAGAKPVRSIRGGVSWVKEAGESIKDSLEEENPTNNPTNKASNNPESHTLPSNLSNLFHLFMGEIQKSAANGVESCKWGNLVEDVDLAKINFCAQRAEQVKGLQGKYNFLKEKFERLMDEIME